MKRFFIGAKTCLAALRQDAFDLAVRTRLLLDSIDAWLLTQPSLVNQRKRALLPVVRERQALADALARYLAQLGLERRAKQVPDLQSYLAARAKPAGEGS